MHYSRPTGDPLPLYLTVLRCQAGDERAFGQLFTEFGERTLQYLTGLVGDDSEDVQQEVWLTVYRGLAGLSNPGAFRTWLFQTTRHRALDYLRRRRREMVLLERVSLEASDTALIPDDNRSTFDIDIPDFLDRLSPVQREVLLLRYHNDLNYADIAVITGCSVGTVKSRLHHARRRLQELVLSKTDPGQPHHIDPE